MGARDAEADAPAEQDSVDALVEATHDHPAARRARRPRRFGAAIAWLMGAVALAGAAVAGGVVHVSANERFDDAAHELDAAVEGAEEADESLSSAVPAVSSDIDLAEQISDAAAGAPVDPAARDTFAVTITAATGTVDAAATLLARHADADDPVGAEPVTAERDADGIDADDPAADAGTAKPFWPWELFDAASVLKTQADRADAAARLVAETEDSLAEARTDLDAAATALYASVAPAAESLEAANVSAGAYAVLDFRDAAAAASVQSELGPGALAALRDYAERAGDLEMSAQIQLAEKAGPLLETRLEVEAFARSIAGGVVLDFDWAPVVAGAGGANSLGGSAVWDADRGGAATLIFSDSVAEWWPDEAAAAVVAHEVGHAISAKCVGFYDTTLRSVREEWATAWAISMGHTSYANGTQAYGYPRQEMIDLAATCR